MNSIWKTLSAINVNDHVEKKGNLSYLSWPWAWATLQAHYPDSHYEPGEVVRYDDGTVEVWMTVTVQGTFRTMWLPVMDNRNNAIQNPTARQISDTRMRCLVKCIAMFGLGHYIYAGEDLPPKEPDPLATEAQLVELDDFDDYMDDKQREWLAEHKKTMTYQQAKMILDKLKEKAA